MKKILVMGNSHSATIRAGETNADNNGIVNNLELNYLIIGNTNGGLRDVQITENNLDFSSVKKSTQGFRSLSLPSLDLSYYDFFSLQKS